MKVAKYARLRLVRSLVTITICLWAMLTGIAVNVDYLSGPTMLVLTHVPAGKWLMLVTMAASMLTLGGLCVIIGRLWWGTNLRTAHAWELPGWTWMAGGSVIYAAVPAYHHPGLSSTWIWGGCLASIAIIQIARVIKIARNAEVVQRARDQALQVLADEVTDTAGVSSEPG